MLEPKWIKAPQSKDGAAVIFETTFFIDRPVHSAVLTASALGVYEPLLNGKLLSHDKFLPGWTNYHKRIQFQTMNVASLLQGKNTLQLHAAPGWAIGHMGYDDSDKNYGNEISVTASLCIHFVDGTETTIATDENWKAFSSQIVFSDIYHGETVDRTAPYTLLGTAVPAQVEGLLIPHEGEFVHELDRIAEVRRFITPAGETVIDFGQNLAGYVEVSVHGKRGERIVMRHAETLDANGNFYTANLRRARAKNTYVLSGKGVESFKPTFSWQGFRYICLDEFPKGAFDSAQFTAIAISSDVRRTGHFVCGHTGINQLYHNLIWSQKANFIDVPTDCPQRDERLGWLGDAQIFCQTAALNYDVLRFFRKWLKDIALEQHEDGAVPGIAPVVMKTRVTRISAAWGDAAVICPWVMYQTYGNKQVLADQYESMCRWVCYIRDTAEGGRYLWTGGNQYGDWLGMDNGPGVYEGATPKDFIATAYYAYSTGLLIKVGKVLGHDVQEYEALYAGIVRAFTETFTFDDLPTCMTQTACALMLFFGLCQDAQKVADALAHLIVENDRRLNTGFVGTPYLLYALSEHGYAGLAYDLLLQEAYPSWLYSIGMGATSMWEHWDGINDHGEMWDTHMNSFNHYAYGAVGEWLYRTAAGIRTVEAAPGFTHVVFCPIPEKRLGFVEASINTKHGEIRSAWYLQGDSVRYELVVPHGVSATVRLPGVPERTVDAGSWQFIAPYVPQGKL